MQANSVWDVCFSGLGGRNPVALSPGIPGITDRIVGPKTGPENTEKNIANPGADSYRG